MGPRTGKEGPGTDSPSGHHEAPPHPGPQGMSPTSGVYGFAVTLPKAFFTATDSSRSQHLPGERSRSPSLIKETEAQSVKPAPKVRVRQGPGYTEGGPQ